MALEVILRELVFGWSHYVRVPQDRAGQTGGPTRYSLENIRDYNGGGDWETDKGDR